MSDRSVHAGGNISGSIVVTGDGNHASIHFGEGVTLPLARQQRLSKRRRAPTADNLLPLLRADSLAFDVVGRENELAELRGWIDGEADVSVQTLIGRAGTGKTRLAIELCRRIDGAEKPGEAGWAAGFLRPADIASVVDQLATRQLASGEPTLLVVDYASAVHRELARWFDRLAASDFDGKLRFLLLDREAPEGFGWWHDLAHPALGGDRASLFVDPDRPRRLPDLSDIASRRALFGAALKATADLLGERAVTADAPIEDPVFDAALAEERFGNPLNLAMAGLIAAERGRREALALRRLEAARFIARREVKRLELLGESCRPPIPVAVMRHSLGFNGLVGGLPVATLRSEFSAELREAGLATAMDELPALLERELPREGREADDGAEPRLGTVQPDLVGEGVIVETLLTGPASQRAAAVDTFRRAYASGGGRSAEALMRLLQDYGYAAEDPDAGEEERRTGESLLLLLPAVADSIPDEDFLRLEPLVAAFPTSTTVLREAAAAQTQRLARIWKAISDSTDRFDEETIIVATSRRAGWLNNLGYRLSHLGRREEALAMAQEAVELYRRLAAIRPDAFTPGLAAALINLSNQGGDLGRREEALAVAQEAVKLYRRLAAFRPEAFAPNLALSINNLANRLSDVGGREQALALAQEAVEIRRRLVAAQPDAFASDLTMSLNNLAGSLRDLGRCEEALAAAQEAVDLDRRIAAARPDAFMPALAGSLINLANCLSDLSRREQALAVAQEAVKLFRRLAASRPEAFAPDLAMSLNNLANILSDLGRREDALEAAQEAVDIRRRLAAARPDAFAPDLAMSLSVLGDRMEENERLSEAVEADHESIRVLAPHFLSHPRAFARAMIAYLRDYVRRSEAAGVEMDAALVGPLIEKLNLMNEEQEK